MAEGYQMLEASTNRFEKKLDELMIMMAKQYQVSLLMKLFYREYSDLGIQQKRPFPVIVGDPQNNLIHRTPKVNLSKDVPPKEKDDQILEGIDDVVVNISYPKQSMVEHSKLPSSSNNKDVLD